MTVEPDRIQHLLRELALQVLGSLVRRFPDFAASEDALQEALLAAAMQWQQGIPENPRGWRVKVAGRRRRARIRAEAGRRNREELVVGLGHPVGSSPSPPVSK